MRTSFPEEVGTIDFIGDFLLFAFIAEFKTFCPDTGTIANREQKRAFGLPIRS